VSAPSEGRIAEPTMSSELGVVEVTVVERPAA